MITVLFYFPSGGRRVPEKSLLCGEPEVNTPTLNKRIKTCGYVATGEDFKFNFVLLWDLVLHILK